MNARQNLKKREQKTTAALPEGEVSTAIVAGTAAGEPSIQAASVPVAPGGEVPERKPRSYRPRNEGKAIIHLRDDLRGMGSELSLVATVADMAKEKRVAPDVMARQLIAESPAFMARMALLWNIKAGMRDKPALAEEAPGVLEAFLSEGGEA